MRTITFRRVTRLDFPLLASWLCQPRVARWWNHEFSPEAIERDFGKSVDGNEPCEDHIVLLDDQPIGLIQYSSYADYPDEATALERHVALPTGRAGPYRRPCAMPRPGGHCYQPASGRSHAGRSNLTTRSTTTRTRSSASTDRRRTSSTNLVGRGGCARRCGWRHRAAVALRTREDDGTAYEGATGYESHWRGRDAPDQSTRSLRRDDARR